jgi:hypothetical protein
LRKLADAELRPSGLISGVEIRRMPALEAYAVAAVIDVKCRTLATVDIERSLAALERREQGTKRQ